VTALAAKADVETVLGRTLTAAEDAKLAGALAAASRLVRTVTGRRYEVGTFTVRRRVRDCQVVLDSPTSVGTVAHVCFDGTAETLTGWVLRGDIVYGIRNGGGWVDVTYTVATPTPPAVLVPADVVAIVAAITARRLTSSVPVGAVSYSETTGPFAESATFERPTDSTSPTGDELQTLGLFALRRPGPLTSL
jgi:hypothetical protein